MKIYNRLSPVNTNKMPTSYTKPFLKWVGGKTQIIETVISLFPREINNYYEPFLGGGSVLLGFLSSVNQGHVKLTGSCYASDVNKNLIGLYQVIQSNPEELIEQVGALSSEYLQINGTDVNRSATTIEEAKTSQESYYYWIRKQYNIASASSCTSSSIAIKISAMFIFLNKTCFRGIYREGPRGFNVPFGNYKNPVILDKEHISEVSELIKSVVFSVASFEHALTSAESNMTEDTCDFVYLDPPYAPETTTSFVGYTADGFSLSDHERLFQLCNSHAHLYRMLMSNAAVSLVMNAFHEPTYTTTVVSCRRAIHSTKPGTKTNEVLIRNYSDPA